MEESAPGVKWNGTRWLRGCVVVEFGLQGRGFGFGFDLLSSPPTTSWVGTVQGDVSGSILGTRFEKISPYSVTCDRERRTLQSNYYTTRQIVQLAFSDVIDEYEAHQRHNEVCVRVSNI